MRKPTFLAALALFVTVPAFAGDLTGFKITRPAAAPCQIEVARVYQVGQTGPLHVALHNNSTHLTTGKLTAATKVGTNMVMDGTSFNLQGGGYQDYVASKNPRGALAGQDIMLAFTECTVAMH
jgi:hypothetical protein